MMPLMFLVSGASIFYAMDKPGAGKFFKDKVLRLFIPLLVAVFTYSILQVYLERITHGQFSGSFFAFLPHYFEGVYMEPGLPGGNFAFHGLHMWYVMILFLYSILLYPLFRWWRGSGRGALQKLGNTLAFPWTMYLALAFPILFVHNWTSDTAWEFGAGGWPFLFYIFFILYGFMIDSHERLQWNIRRMRWISLGVGLILGAIYVFLDANADNPAIAPYEDMFSDTVYILSAAALLPAFFGFAMQYLTVNTPFLKYASEAVMGFYILHQTVLLVIGYFVVRWAAPDLVKWMIISASSFVVIMALYEYVVRRFNVIRFLFGMRPLQKQAVVKTREAVLAR
jgi:hypothetical protein